MVKVSGCFRSSVLLNNCPAGSRCEVGTVLWPLHEGSPVSCEKERGKRGRRRGACNTEVSVASLRIGETFLPRGHGNWDVPEPLSGEHLRQLSSGGPRSDDVLWQKQRKG